jgi:hypothetical protein
LNRGKERRRVFRFLRFQLFRFLRFSLFAYTAKNIVGTFDELVWNPSPILHIEAETDNQAVLINPGPKIELQLLGGRRLFFSSSRR